MLPLRASVGVGEMAMKGHSAPESQHYWSLTIRLFNLISNSLVRGDVLPLCKCRLCCVLTSDPAKHAIPKTVEAAYSIGVGELGWQYGTGLKSHGTVTNWCTGRGWPVNSMTVISARWWSKHAIPKTAEVDIPLAIYGKRLSGRWTII